VRRYSRRLAHGSEDQNSYTWLAENISERDLAGEEPVPNERPDRDTQRSSSVPAETSRENEREEEEALDKTALAKFHRHSINTSLWRVFDDITNMRIAYIGTPVSNLSKLVEDEIEFTGPQAPSLHFPFPSIRPPLPWKPPQDLTSIRCYSQSFINDISSLPPEDLRVHLIDTFFKKIHPGFPIVDETQFRNAYGNRNTDNSPPLLLLQAILLAGAHASDHPSVEKSRSLIKRSIFRRAKALFEAHYENDRMHLVQAALLFTWHADGADDVSANAYYWIGVACRIAFGLGMHRNLGENSASRMPLDERRIYRRIWWTLVQLDVFISLHHGQPLMISTEDCDQPPLQIDDFIETGSSERNPNIDVDFCIQNTCLCEILRSILRLSSPGAAREQKTNPSLFKSKKSSIDFELSNWYLHLPTRLKDFNGPHATFWPLQLQMHYNVALLHLHRLPRPTTSSHEDLHTSETSHETCRSSAQSIANILETMVSSKHIAQCWFTCLTSLLASAIQLCFEARSASRIWTSTLEIQAQNRLARLLDSAFAISRHWSSAEAIFHLYKNLLKQLAQSTRLNFESQRFMMIPTLDSVALASSPNTDELALRPSEDPENNLRQHRIHHFEEELTALFGAGQTYGFSSPDESGFEGNSSHLWGLPNT
jgi:transcriptional regulatory protein AMDR